MPLIFIALFNIEEFCGFDWGSDVKNMKHHGSVQPPIYQLKDVSTKVNVAVDCKCHTLFSIMM